MGKKRAFIIIQVILGFQGKWDCYNGTNFFERFR